MAHPESLYNCYITYHLKSGQTIEEIFKQDMPKEVWKAVLEEFLSTKKYIEIEPREKFDKLLLPKENLSYITLSVPSCENSSTH